MAEQIRMTPAAMRARSGEFAKEGENVEMVNNKMSRLIDQLQSEWEGQAARKFADQYAQLEPSFKRMRELIADISKQLSQTAEAVEAMDREIASKFGVQ